MDITRIVNLHERIKQTNGSIATEMGDVNYVELEKNFYNDANQICNIDLEDLLKMSHVNETQFIQTIDKIKHRLQFSYLTPEIADTYTKVIVRVQNLGVFHGNDLSKLPTSGVRQGHLDGFGLSGQCLEKLVHFAKFNTKVDPTEIVLGIDEKDRKLQDANKNRNKEDMIQKSKQNIKKIKKKRMFAQFKNVFCCGFSSGLQGYDDLKIEERREKDQLDFEIKTPVNYKHKHIIRQSALDLFENVSSDANGKVQISCDSLPSSYLSQMSKWYTSVNYEEEEEEGADKEKADKEKADEIARDVYECLIARFKLRMEQYDHLLSTHMTSHIDDIGYLFRYSKYNFNPEKKDKVEEILHILNDLDEIKKVGLVEYVYDTPTPFMNCEDHNNKVDAICKSIIELGLRKSKMNMNKNKMNQFKTLFKQIIDLEKRRNNYLNEHLETKLHCGFYLKLNEESKRALTVDLEKIKNTFNIENDIEFYIKNGTFRNVNGIQSQINLDVTSPEYIGYMLRIQGKSSDPSDSSDPSKSSDPSNHHLLLPATMYGNFLGVGELNSKTNNVIMKLFNHANTLKAIDERVPRDVFQEINTNMIG